MTPRPVSHAFEAYRRTGDPVALGRVFDAVAPDLRRVARRLAVDPTAADDLVQDTFLAAMEGSAGWDSERPVGAWMLGILANRARRSFRDRDRARRETDVSAVESELEAGGRSAGDEVAASELSRLIRSAVGALPASEREAVAARLFDGVAPRELAEELGLRAGAVRVRLHRGMTRLRAALPAGFALGASWVQLRGRVLEAAAKRAGAADGGSVGTGIGAGMAGGVSAAGPLRLAAIGVIAVGAAGLGARALLGSIEPETEVAAAPELARPVLETASVATVSSLGGDRRPVVTESADLAEPPPVSSADEEDEAAPFAAPFLGGYLEGRVLDASGNPLAGVEVRGWNGRRAKG